MSSIMSILGTSTPVSEILAEKLGYVKAAIACKVFFYEQLKEGVCSASVGTIAKKLGMSAGTVSSNLAWLRKNGYIIVIGEHKSGNVTNKYKVTKKFYDGVEHSADESEHSADESNIQQMNGKEEIEEEIEERTTSDSDSDERLSIISQAYETEIGFISPAIGDKMKCCIDTYPFDWIPEAIGIAATHNKRSWAYVEGILRRWQTEGKNNGHKPTEPKPQKEREKVLDPVTGEWTGAYYLLPEER